MKEELKKSLRTYGALLLLGVTGVPLGAAVGLIEALFCRLLLKVTAVRVAHLFWCLPFLAMAGLVIVAVNQKFGGRGKGGMSLIFDVAYEEETEPSASHDSAGNALNGVDASVRWKCRPRGRCRSDRCCVFLFCWQKITV